MCPRLLEWRQLALWNRQSLASWRQTKRKHLLCESFSRDLSVRDARGMSAGSVLDFMMPCYIATLSARTSISNPFLKSWITLSEQALLKHFVANGANKSLTHHNVHGKCGGPPWNRILPVLGGGSVFPTALSRSDCRGRCSNGHLEVAVCRKLLRATA